MILCCAIYMVFNMRSIEKKNTDILKRQKKSQSHIFALFITNTSEMLHLHYTCHQHTKREWIFRSRMKPLAHSNIRLWFSCHMQ